MGHRILIVDDQPHVLEQIVSHLEATGEPYTLYQALEAGAALRIAGRTKPDLVVTDWEMPGRSGIELTRDLKADEALRDVPVIMATGVMTTSENLRTALEAGCVDYLRKPIDPVELRARVRAALELADSTREIRRQREALLDLNRRLAAANAGLEEKNRELSRLSVTDYLTGVYNRTFLMEMLVKEVSRSQRHRTPLCCVMIDVDHFKLFNDEHGHLAGDHVLKETARLVAGTVRTGDVFGRYGGEEFLLVLPNVTEENGRLAAEKVRERVEGARVEFEGSLLQTTISLGVAESCPPGSRSVAELIHNADLALYQAKSRGRNRVVPFSGLSP